MEILLLYISDSKNNFWHGFFFFSQPPNMEVLSFTMMCQTVANLLFLFSFLQRDNEDEELCSVFVPTNHLYIGDIFLVNSKIS